MCTACSTDSADPVFAGEDGYCPSCGRRVVADRDHMEEDLGQVAGNPMATALAYFEDDVNPPEKK